MVGLCAQWKVLRENVYLHRTASSKRPNASWHISTSDLNQTKQENCNIEGGGVADRMVSLERDNGVSYYMSNSCETHGSHNRLMTKESIQCSF
jgi:hypothetical protein